MVVRWLARVLCVATTCTSTGLLVGCASDAMADDRARDAAVYQTVIIDLVDRSGAVLDDSEGLPVLYVEGFAAAGIPLEVQVEVVAGFANQYEIRFIDELDEAIESDEIDRPVRGNGLLVGLGPVVGDGTADLRGEFYLRDGDLQAYGYTLRPTSDSSWVIVGDPEPIAPEGLAAVP